MKSSRHVIFKLRELGRRDGEFSTERIEGLAAQDSNDDIPLATGRRAPLIDADGTWSLRSGVALPALRCVC